jgi:hypothetical protein
VAAIQDVGGRVLPRYGATETGMVGQGCLAPEASDDLHFRTDLYALIQPGADAGTTGLLPRALLVTSTRRHARLLLINVSLGDHAVLTRRACGCPLERLGWTTHVHSLRSHARLTAGGMTFSDADVVRVLERDLPARFGGSPTDYQIWEEEHPDGSPRLRLLVHPALGPLDEDAVVQGFLESVGRGTGAERIMSLAWRDARLVRVERKAPAITASGKILHWRQVRSTAASARPS